MTILGALIVVASATRADTAYIEIAEDLSWTPESATIIFTCDKQEGALLFPIMRKEKEGSISSLWRVAGMVEIPPSCKEVHARVMYKNRRKVQVSQAKIITREKTPECFATSAVLSELITEQKNKLLEREKEHTQLQQDLEKKKQLADSLGGLQEILAIRERVSSLSMHLSRLDRVQSIIEASIERAKNAPRPVQYESRMNESVKALDLIVKALVKTK
jgi:hypothetical protein